MLLGLHIYSKWHRIRPSVSKSVLNSLTNEQRPLQEHGVSKSPFSLFSISTDTPVLELTPQDIVSLRPKFWQMHMDLVNPIDGGATTLLTIQYNLAAGTLAPFAFSRPELQPLLKRIMNFDVLWVASWVKHVGYIPNEEDFWQSPVSAVRGGARSWCSEPRDHRHSLA